jgi:NAD(P)-dependent dehydrogenase (short-subunit alcohol dehydrogenase family)
MNQEEKMSGPMTGRVALVTGGSSGIGRAAALAFAREGAKVAVANRTQTTGEEVVRSIQASGGEALWIKTDVSRVGEVDSLVKTVVGTYGHLDYAFNNAGSGGRGGWLAEIEEKDWDETIDIYLKSVWACMKYEIQAMLEKGGVIVNNSSVDGQRAFPWNPVYSAAKHGVIGLTKSAAVQYADKGIRINAVCPGWIKTPPVEEMLQHNPDAAKGMLMHQPIGRFGEPEEVAEAVVWLCSNAASFVLGTALGVDGGYLAV